MTIRRIRRPLIRLLVLIVIGIPCLCYWPLTLLSSDLNTFSFVGMWLFYMLFLHVLIILNVGVDDWAVWFAAACVLACVTVGSAVLVLGILDHLGVLELLTRAGIHVPDSKEGQYTKTMWSWEQLRKGLMIVTVIPFAIFVIQSFSVASGIERAARWAGRRGRYAGHALMALRVLQHVAEILGPMILIWREEHPDLIKPRLREDVRGFVHNARDIITWIIGAIVIWTKATLVFALEPVPMFCWTIESQLSSTKPQGGK